jgi:hypothetical protein
MAERMRAQPKAAVPLLENGEIERWFGDNGWTYPVHGKPAKGIAAVQQFFEGMGLSKPPVVQLSEDEVQVPCRYPEMVSRQVAVRTAAKKWVYAQVQSDAPWLKAVSPSVSGPQQAAIPFDIDTSMLPANGTHEGQLAITANAGQTLKVRVRAEVQGVPLRGQPGRPVAGTPLPRSRVDPALPEDAASHPAPLLSARVPRNTLAHAVGVGAVAGLVFRSLLTVPVDLYARLAAASPATPAPGSFASWLQPPLADTEFVRHVVLATWWLGAVLGFLLLRKRGSRGSDVLFGIVAGGVAGVAGSATLACLMPALDALPRALLHQLARALGGASGVGGPVVAWTAAWVAVALLCWIALGAAAGLVLTCAGSGGARLLNRVERGLAAVFRLFRLGRAAAYYGGETGGPPLGGAAAKR